VGWNASQMQNVFLIVHYINLVSDLGYYRREAERTMEDDCRSSPGMFPRFLGECEQPNRDETQLCIHFGVANLKDRKRSGGRNALAGRPDLVRSCSTFIPLNLRMTSRSSKTSQKICGMSLIIIFRGKAGDPSELVHDDPTTRLRSPPAQR
jgi:hypothetical protein